MTPTTPLCTCVLAKFTRGIRSDQIFVCLPTTGGVTDWANGWRQGRAQDHTDFPDHLLARATQGSHVHQYTRRTYEHGGALEAEDDLWPCPSHFHVSMSHHLALSHCRLQCTTVRQSPTPILPLANHNFGCVVQPDQCKQWLDWLSTDWGIIPNATVAVTNNAGYGYGYFDTPGGSLICSEISTYRFHSWMSEMPSDLESWHNWKV